MGNSNSIEIAGYGRTLDESVAALRTKLQVEYDIDLVELDDHLGILNSNNFNILYKVKYDTKWGYRYKAYLEIDEKYHKCIDRKKITESSSK